MGDNLQKSFKRAMAAAAKSASARPDKSKSKRPSNPDAPIAITRYGYLIVDWPVVQDDMDQSGGGAVLLGQADELTISRGSHPASKEAHAQNLQRLKDDTRKILGPNFSIIEKNGNLFVGPN